MAHANAQHRKTEDADACQLQTEENAKRIESEDKGRAKAEAACKHDREKKLRSSAKMMLSTLCKYLVRCSERPNHDPPLRT